jgi:hypothetical protein
MGQPWSLKCVNEQTSIEEWLRQLIRTKCGGCLTIHAVKRIHTGVLDPLLAAWHLKQKHVMIWKPFALVTTGSLPLSFECKY